MSRLIKKKVIVYVVKDEKLLVFRHTDFSYEEVGIQVPAGTVKEGENLEAAALREVQEETGYTTFKITSYLGTENFDMYPTKDEVQERHFFRAEPTKELPERWVSKEEHDGKQPPTNFECFWVPLKSGHILQAGQSALLSKL